MSHLKDFNWTGFWKDTDYAFESYIGREVTDEDIKNAEAELGYTLPAAVVIGAMLISPLMDKRFI